MWRRWSRALELLGNLRVPFPMKPAKGVSVGDPRSSDAAGGAGWREFLRGDRLFDVWGPHPRSPWGPFHCVPLFAALDSLKSDRVGPARPRGEPSALPPRTPPAATAGWPPPADLEAAPSASVEPDELPTHARPGAPRPGWVNGVTWTIIDLPGSLAVEAAAWMITSGGCQPVCTFDHWPHPRGLLRPENILAELLRWATTVAEVRPELIETSPPLWICDSERLGTRKGKPREFDNRYYLDDSILPGPLLLRRAGIERVVYVTLRGEEIPLLDLEAYFGDLLALGVEVLWVDLLDPAMRPQPFSAPRTPRRIKRKDFHPSAAGGFGTEIPQPSSGGGSGG
jgi:hypothetical protein